MKLEPFKVLLILKLWLDGMTTKHLHKCMDISRYTLYKLLKKVVKIIVPKYYSSFIIGGSDVIIEADESKFGRRKYNKGHKVEGVWVFGCVERTTERRIFLAEVAKRNTETLQEMMKKYIHKNSIIYTDCWKAYNG
ncbi:hypothetical protein H311_01944, partial [Anncaliia algerae PRA109]